MVLVVRDTKRGLRNNDEVKSCSGVCFLPVAFADAVASIGVRIAPSVAPLISGLSDVTLRSTLLRTFPGQVREALRQNFPSFDVVEFFGNGTTLAQLEMFATASIIVAPHGAGLSNVVVSPLHTPVLEIAPFM